MLESCNRAIVSFFWVLLFNPLVPTPAFAHSMTHPSVLFNVRAKSAQIPPPLVLVHPPEDRPIHPTHLAPHD